MSKVIHPKKILEAFRRHGDKPSVTRDDLLLIEELEEKLSLTCAIDEALFYNELKKMVSAFNQETALTGRPSIDFDDLYTKYSEYIAVLQPFILC